SNQVLITVVDGGGLQADSIGSGAGTESLTAPQLQPIVAQAIDAWRAAGADPQLLSALEHVGMHVGNLPRAELGLASAGEIGMDRNAAGWGWATNGAPGKMDLLTVVTHELGHLLGFEHQDTGVMEATLAPGVRSVPEALASTSNVVVLAASPGSSGL